MIWLGMFIGIFIMQLATFIVVFVTQENEDVVIPFSVFIFYPFVLMINKSVKTIKHKRWVKKQIEKLNKEGAQVIELKNEENVQ